jgi:hypothetical protein
VTTTTALVAGAIRAHNTDTSDGGWDAETARRNLPSEAGALREAHAWVDGAGSADAKGSYRLVHHNVTQAGTVGAANLTGCLNAIHALNRAGSSVPAGDRAAAYAHLKNHLIAGGRPEHAIPALREAGEAAVDEPVTAAADTAAPTPEADANGAVYRKWRALAVTEGVWTGDDRFIEPQALTWRDFPLPLMAQTETAPGHDGAQLVGRIDAAERVDASTMVDSRTGKKYGEGAQAIMLSGVLDSDELAESIAGKISGGFLRGVSVDLSDVEYVDELTDADGNVIEDVDEAIDSGDVDPMDIRLRTRVTAGRIMALTCVPTPAFEGAYIELLSDEGEAGPSTGPGQPTREQAAAAIHDVTTLATRECAPCASGLTAAAAPIAPLAAWFADPALDGPTPVTVTDDGRVYGHLASWDTCHTGMSGRCVTPPRSSSGYSLFRTGAVQTVDGGLVAVGRLTVGTGHAGTTRAVDAVAAMAHYDDTGTAVADVAAGEDAHGIWVAGALRPDATAEQIRVLRASPLSGDWRAWGGGLELVAALAVNTPGFPVVRQIVAGGRPVALVAAGPRPDTTPPELAELRDLMPDVRAAAERERAAREAETAALTASAADTRRRMLTARAADLRARMSTR